MTITKYINLLLTAIQNLNRFKAKTIAVVLPLTISMSVISFMMFTRGGFIKDTLIAEKFLPDITVQSTEAGRVAKISTDMIEKFGGIPHIKKIIPRVWGYIPLNIDDTDISYTLMGLDLDKIDYHKHLPWTLEQGFFLTKGDRNKAVLGEGCALSLNASVGDTLSIEDTLGNTGQFKLIGILGNTVQVYSTDLILVSIEDARQFFGYKKNEASDLLIYVDDFQSADKIAWEITTTFPNTRVLTAKALTNLVIEAFGRRGGTFQMMWLILLVTLLLILWAQTAHISVDMSKEIGILKATGWLTSDIIIMRMMESLVIGLTGTSVGILIGFIYGLMGTPGISGYCIGCASIYPKFPVPVHCDIQSLLILSIMGVVPIMVISALPSWLAGIIDPDVAIRK